MKKINPANRISELMEAAAKVFISRGYRRTTMADIAREMGVAPGTLYLYVESKEALFDLLVRRTMAPDADIPELPARTPAPGATVAMLKEAAALKNLVPRLMAALAGQCDAKPKDELKAIIGEIYDSLYRYRAGINLMERSAIDWPEIADVFYRGIRQELIAALTRYLERGITAGSFRPMPDAAISARFILESIAWFAIHRHGDRGPRNFSDEAARETVVDMLLASICKQ